MKAFWNLVGFEYKKIWRKKSVRITLLLSVLIMLISVPASLFGTYYLDGEPFESHYDGMIKGRSYARELSGRPLDTALIMEMASAYKQIPEADVYQSTQEYQAIARPYSEIYGSVRTVFNTASKRFNLEDMQALTEAQAENFYATRRERLEESVRQTRMGDKAKESVLELDEQIQIPFVFDYTDGYTRFFVMANTAGMLAAFAMAICLAPLFSGEYTSGADQLILSAKHGKNRVISAKLFTGFSLSALFALLMLGLAYCESLAIFGADGRNAPLQLYSSFYPYPLTMGQTALLLAICAFFACMMTAAITMLLSAKLKAAFGVIILVTIFLFAPMLGNVSSENLLLYNLYRLLPAPMTSLQSIADIIQYEFGSIVLPPYMALPLFGLAVSVLATPFAYRAFKKHQVV